MSEVLRGTLHYEVDEEGLHVSQKEESALLPWEQIYKMVATKHNVLVYSSRINAYVIPRAQLGESYAALQTPVSYTHLDVYKRQVRPHFAECSKLGKTRIIEDVKRGAD